MITIKDVEDCFEETLRVKATPHRTPDFEKLRAEYGGDTPVKGRMWFIEEHNTGYGGLLERWEFVVDEPDLPRASFWADLLPGMFGMAPKTVSH